MCLREKLFEHRGCIFRFARVYDVTLSRVSFDDDPERVATLYLKGSLGLFTHIFKQLVFKSAHIDLFITTVMESVLDVNMLASHSSKNHAIHTTQFAADHPGKPLPTIFRHAARRQSQTHPPRSARAAAPQATPAIWGWTL